jgi:hypothetical protein
VSPASAGKRQREKARKDKADAKAARRFERSAAAPDPDADPGPRPPVDEEALIAELAELHKRFEDGELEYDDFAAAKDDVTRRLRVE